MVTVGLTFLFNMVSVVHRHFKGHRLLKGTHLNFMARLFKRQLRQGQCRAGNHQLKPYFFILVRIRANRALNILAQNIAVNCKHLSYQRISFVGCLVGVFTLKGVNKPTMDHVNYFTIANIQIQPGLKVKVLIILIVCSNKV